MSVAVELVRVTVKDRRRIVLDGVSLTLDAGQGLAIAASSGRNATALLRVMAGLQRPTVGRARLAAQEPSHARRHGLVGMTPSLEDMDGEKSGTRMLIELGRLKGLRQRRADAEAAHWLEAFALEGLASHPFGSWPTSARGALAVAAALLGRPRIVILDAGLGAIEPPTRGHVVSCLSRLKEQGAAIVVVDRNYSISAAVCDSVALLHDAVLIGSGSAEEIRRSARGLLYAYALQADRCALPEGDGVTARRTDEGILVLAERDVTQELVDRYGGHVVAQREPTLQEACEWMLEHPDQIVSRSKLWGRDAASPHATG